MLWRKVWREGVVPNLTETNLRNLKAALERDDAALCQGETTCPPPLACLSQAPCEKACALGYCGLSDGLQTVGEVEEFFARMCKAIDDRMGELAACRWFLNWFDDTPRNQMCRELIEEINLALEGKQYQQAA